MAAHGDTLSLSLAHKRWSQGEIGKVVIEDLHRTAAVSIGFAQGGRNPVPCEPCCLTTTHSRPVCALSGLARPRGRAGSGADNRHVCPASFADGVTLRSSLDTHARLLHDIAVLRAQAEKEKQINRRVELNLEMKRLEAELVVIGQSLRCREDI